ncbi:MAG TPA: pilus assembly protein N-terminal domain-containing protein [Burkholderiaceae bacterium]|nr:pilus assembly protein N-terminal domain-containing protein [Burkholderiaceae bacterium]
MAFSKYRAGQRQAPPCIFLQLLQLFKLLLCVCLTILSINVGAAYGYESSLTLQVGEVRVLTIPDVARVAVGDGQLLNAVTTEEKEVILFARRDGISTLQVWAADGTRYHYQVTILPEGTRQIQHELKQVIERIPQARVSTVGDKLLVEGEELSDDDRERVAELSRRYPQLLDFTSQVGWDRMVLLDVQVVEVPRNRLQELGVRWAPQSSGGLTAGLAWESGSKNLLDRPAFGQEMAPMPLAYPASSAAAYFGINSLLMAQINVMAQTGSAVILAQPQLLARSGSTAEFLAGGEVPYSTVDSNGNSSTSFKPYGVSLRITPKIERNHIVRSHVEVEVSSIDASLSVPNGPSLKTRRASTEINVRSGQTLVLAGFLSREESRNVHKVPGLGDIPLIGELFRSTRFQNAETELAIFVTPVVVTPDHPDLLERVNRGGDIIKNTFTEPERLNVPVRETAISADTSLQNPPSSFVQGRWGWEQQSQWVDSVLTQPVNVID